MKKLLVLVPIVLTACTQMLEPNVVEEIVEEVVMEATVKEKLPDNKIDFESIEVGSQIGGMRISDIDYYSNESYGEPNSYNSTLYFVGPVSVTANYSHSPEDQAFFSDMLCLEDIEFGDAFPYVEGDLRSKRLCFTNNEQAQEMLGTEPGDEGRTTVTIDAYQWIGREGEVINRALLVEIVE